MFLITLYWYINKIKKMLGLVTDREPYVLGRTQLTMDECYEALIPICYQYDYFAWEDVGEGLSVRKLYGDRQIHVRVFTDGEVRVHDEFNYEYSPLGHYNGETLMNPAPEELEKITAALKVEQITDKIVEPLKRKCTDSWTMTGETVKQE